MLLESAQRWLRTERTTEPESRLPATARWVRAHPTATDSVLAGLLMAAVVPQLAFHARAADPQLVAYAVLSVLMILPLALRRRWPMLVFVTVATVGAVQWVIGVQLAADLSVLIALTTVAASYPVRGTLVAAAIAEVGAVAAAWSWPHGLRFSEMLTVLSGFVLAAVASGAFVRSRRRLVEFLQGDMARLQEDRARLAELAVADERVRIARDMHDVIGHGLTVIVTLAAASVRRATRQPERVDQAVALIEQTARTALTDTRAAVRGLRTDDVLRPTPTVADVPTLLDTARAAGLHATVNVEGPTETLPPGVGVCVYRITQEAITNTLKHASATAVVVTIAVTDHHLLLCVEDDGAGIAAAAVHDGVGVIGMRERVASVGGSLSVGRAAGGGWRVAATLPLGASSPGARG